ncbi:MAG: ABC transporter permease subunit [Clostridium sp.]|nr:ABC transporter permease subunit [Clostridium sp.]
MFSLIQNEFIKLRYRKKFIITVVILVALCALFAFAYAKLSNLETPDMEIKSYQTNIDLLQKEKSSTSDKTKKAQYEQTIEKYKNAISQIKLSEKTSSSNWKSALKNNITLLKAQKSNADNLTEENSKEYFNKQIITDNYYIDHNIKPAKENETSAQSYLLSLLSLIGAILIPIIIAIIASDIVSGEFTPPTMKVLLTRPISRTKLILSKYFTAILASVGVIMIVEILAYVVSGLIFGFGNPNNPTTIGTTYTKSLIKDISGSTNLIPVLGSSHIIPYYEFIILTLLFEVIYIIACASIFFLVSTLLKSSAISMAISIVLPVVCAILGQIPYLKKIFPFLFTQYGSFAVVINGNIATTTGAAFVTPLFSVLLLVVLSVITCVASVLLFRKRDMLL